MSEGSEAREIDLGNHFGDVVVKANGTQVRIGADGSLQGVPAPVNDTASRATPEIGAIESTGDHKGEIYGGIYPADDKPIWFLAAPRLMDHYNAAAWAKQQGGSLPTMKQGSYLMTLKGKGGSFTEMFNCGDSFPAGFIWLAEPYTGSRGSFWCQRLSNGSKDFYYGRNDFKLPVLSVRR